MATKKITTKKVTAKKPAAAKTSKPAVKRVTKTTKSKTSKIVGLKSEQEDFMTFRVNRETVYWAVLGAVVILFGLWIMQLQADIQSIYDEIDASTVESDITDMKSTKN